MKSAYPRKATLIEVGPRDGFQFERETIPTELKAAVIESLAVCGFTMIQAVSFVHPRRVPQMADAEALLERLPPLPGVRLNGLVLNEQGLERALATRLDSVEISISASDTHSRRNTGMAREDALARGRRMLRRAKTAGRHVRAGVQCALGCVDEGPIPPTRVTEMLVRLADDGADLLVVADTTGMGSPVTLRRLLDQLQPAVAPIPLALHLHDTRGTGMVNLMTALEYGIHHFDTALGGMGGCPFISGAAGNVATEDVIHFLTAMGIATGVDGAGVAVCSRRLEAFLGRRLPARMLRVADSGVCSQAAGPDAGGDAP